MDFNNKVVLVTGSSRGLGKETIKEFKKLGATVIINYNSSEEQAKLLASELNCLKIKANVANEIEVKKMIDEIIKTCGKLDIVVNNAGICIDNEIQDKTKEEFQKVLETNLIGPFLVSKYSLKYLQEVNGTIINIGSNNPINNSSIYSVDYDASKAGLISMTKNFSKIIRTNIICPGYIDTDMNKDMDEDYKKSELNKIILKRFAEPKEIVDAIVFVASSNYMNGAVINVDGGIN